MTDGAPNKKEILRQVMELNQKISFLPVYSSLEDVPNETIGIVRKEQENLGITFNDYVWKGNDGI